MTDRELIDQLIATQVHVNIAVTAALIELWPAAASPKYREQLTTIHEHTAKLMQLLSSQDRNG
jgi:hypothetical protein